MTTTTFPVSGTFGGRSTSSTVRRAAVVRTTGRAPGVQAAPAATKRTSWTHFFGNAMATWASAGRLPVSE